MSLIGKESGFLRLFCFFLLWILQEAVSSSALSSSYKNRNGAVTKKQPEGVEDSPLTFISTLLNDRVSLTCDINSPVRGDRAIMVLFYKGDIGTPIYNIDVRSGDFDQSSPYVNESVLGSRAYFNSQGSRTGLILDPVKLKDAAQYRCRVDFLKSPTRNARIQLQVVDNPRQLRILNEIGENIHGNIGPFPSGAKVVLRCEVEGGFPRPYVSWRRNGALLDDESEIKTHDLTSNTLTLSNLTRADLFAALSCHGLNSNLTGALSSSVTIDMIFRPIELNLEGGEEPQREDTITSLMCESKGSRPPAEISWWKNGEAMNHAVSKKYNNGNVTRSTIEIAVTKEDHKAQVVCRAKNPNIPSAVLEAIRKIDVLYAPRPTLKAGGGLNMEEIKEGDDLFFDCSIESNPPTSKVEWYYNQVHRLVQNLTAASKILESNQTLVLQAVGREASGKYSCLARNKYGKGMSNNLQLRVKYSPVCVSKTAKVFGAEKNEKMSVNCDVESDPTPTRFEWAFNTSTEVVDLTWFKGHIAQEVSYTPRSDLDFGSLLCWASNEVGLQKVPCVIHVIHAGIPSPVRNCTLRNVSSCCAAVVCLPGWNGGLEQSFTIEVLEENNDEDEEEEEDDEIDEEYDNHGRKEKKKSDVEEISQIRTRGGSTDVISLKQDTDGAPLVLANTATSPYPEFVVEGLRGGRMYLISVRAVNAKGHSEESILTVLTNEEEQQKRVLQEIEPTKPPNLVTSTIITALGVFGSLCIMFLLLGVGCWKRHTVVRKGKSQVELVSEVEGSQVSSRDLTNTAVSGSKPSFQEIVDNSEAPDIIPASKESSEGARYIIQKAQIERKKEPLRSTEQMLSGGGRVDNLNTVWIHSPQRPPSTSGWKDSASLPILRPTNPSQVDHGLLEYLPPPPTNFSYLPPPYPPISEVPPFSSRDIHYQCPPHTSTDCLTVLVSTNICAERESCL